jgi:biopolymer transport protein ExbD
MTLNIKLDGAGQISLDDRPVADLQELESLLSALAMKEPQPDVSLHAESPKDYEAIGKVIYMVHRVGFKDGKFSVS